MKDAIKGIGIFVGLCALIAVTTTGGTALGLWNYRLFGAVTENTRNEIFKHSTAHVEGTIRTLRRYQVEYLQAKDDAERCAIAKMITSESDHVNTAELPDDLAAFISTVRC